MGNCFVTKLKGTVDNDSLLTLGEFSFEGNQVFVSTAGAVSVPARIIEGGVFTDSNTKEIVALSGTNYGVSKVSTIAIKDDYKMNLFRGIENTIKSSILKLRNMVYIEGKVEGKLSDLSNMTSLRVILTYGSDGLQGDLSDLSLISSLEEINLRDCYYIGGNISSLGALTNLTKVNLWATGNKQGHITGSLESLVTAQRAAGRTSGTIQICIYGFPDNSVTFNGQIISTASAAAYSNLVWDSSTITWNGVTVNA